MQLATHSQNQIVQINYFKDSSDVQRHDKSGNPKALASDKMCVLGAGDMF